MSRGPLEVLREVLAVLERSMPTPLELPGETNEHPIRVADRIHDYREAIAQVEALVEAARMASATLGHAYHTTLTGQLAEYAHSDYQKLDAALSPFPPPPGQDSEGGGNG